MKKLPILFTQLAAALLVWTAGLAHADGPNEPIPSFYQEAGLSPNRDYVNQHSSEHIDPFSGKLQWHFVDLFIPGNGGLDIKVQRSYSSLNEILPEDSPFGAGWTLHFGRIIHRAAVGLCDTTLGAKFNSVMELPDGSRQVLYPALDGAYFISPSQWRASCNATSGNFIVTSPDGTRYEMTTLGAQVGTDPAHYQDTYYTTRIVDRNGNTLDFTYGYHGAGSAFGVSTIVASDGRIVTFNYGAGVIESITDGSRIWTYVLSHIPNIGTNQYFLKEVHRPDGLMWAYDYNPSGSGAGTGTPGGYSMKQVIYPTGGTINYTYGFVTFNPTPYLPASTVVTQKAGDSGIWNYTYTPATEAMPFVNGTATYTINPDLPNLAFDKTTVVGPEGTTQYMHVGYTSALQGASYLIGSLLGKATRSMINGQLYLTQVEANGWDMMLLSNQMNIRPGGITLFDDKTYIPRLTGRDISRDGRMYSTTFSNFDLYNNAQTIVETGTDTRTTLLTYYTDPIKWIIRQKKDETTDTIGAITRTFDGNGNMLTENRYGVPTTFTYTPAGDIATKADALSNTIAYLDYHRGIPRTENQPEAVAVTRVVSDAGNVLSQTDGALATTGYTYDGLNRLTGITHPLGNPVSVTWAANSRTVTRGGYTEVVTFDGFGREIQIQHTGSSQTITQTHKYDAIGRRTFTSYPNSSEGTGFFYHLGSRPQFIAHVFNPTSGTWESGRNFQYLNNTVKTTNERGLDFIHTYREYGDPDHRDLLSITVPEPSANVTMTRNGLGQMTQAVQDGKTRTFGYDGHYFLTTMTDPEVGTTTYGRDAVGNMISRQVASSGSTSYGYDGRNRLTTITYPAGTPNVTKTYYKDDKPQSSDNGIARHDYVYNGNKSMTQETLTITGQSPFVTQYAYDANDALNVLTYGSGHAVTYNPDAFGRPTQAMPYVNAVSHHPNGQVAALTYANGLTTTIALNSRQWPNTLGIPGIANMNYTYDDVGNVQSILDTIDTAYNRNMVYDGIDRVTTVNGSWGSGTIGYDGRGNITNQTLGAFALNYNYDPTSNRLASITGPRAFTFTYDTYGNVSGNGTNTFAYNDALNMRCANCGLGTEILYDYDAANMRVRSTKAGVPTHFVYGLNGSLLWEQSPGVVLKEYIYLGGKQIAVRQKNGA